MEVISRWHRLVDGFNTSALEFYDAVEAAISEREVPDATTRRVIFKEAGIASAQREYLRVERGKVAFDICAAPFGNGFFFSWWFVRPGPRNPWIGLLVAFGVFALTGPIILALLMQGLLERGGGAGCSFLLVFLLLPAALAVLGWAVREGHIGPT